MRLEFRARARGGEDMEGEIDGAVGGTRMQGAGG